MGQWELHQNTFRPRIKGHELQYHQCHHHTSIKQPIIAGEKGSSVLKSPSASDFPLEIQKTVWDSRYEFPSVLTTPRGSRQVSNGPCDVILKLSVVQIKRYRCSFVTWNTYSNPAKSRKIIIVASIREETNMPEHLQVLHTRKCFSNVKPNQNSWSILARNHKKIIFHSCQNSKTTAAPKHTHNRTFVPHEALEEMPQGITNRPLIWLSWHSWLNSSQF